MSKPQPFRRINVIGAGLAGCEATAYLQQKGYLVHLYEMRQKVSTPIHQTTDCGELVCSNSLKSQELTNASGLLKAEMAAWNSLVIEAAQHAAIPGGTSLMVDRHLFSQYLTKKINSLPNVVIHHEEVTELDLSLPTILASGPLTSDHLAEWIKDHLDEGKLYFFDAVAPIIDGTKIDHNIAYFKSRYDKGEATYLNCPFSKEEYTLFYDALCHAQTVALHDFEKVYEGCMPIEILAKRGFNAPLFGPLKPVGLYPTMDKPKPFAVLQLRQESFNDDCYNLVGFQTNLTFGEQRRIIHLIPGLKDVEIVRYGVMHRNTYLDAPQVQQNLQSTKYPLLFFAGQLIGVEGYLESASCGLLAASYLHQYLTTNEIIPLSPQTMMGALGRYLNLANQNFTPMGANYGILCSLVSEVEKTKKRLLYYNYSMSETNTYLHWINGLPSRI